MVVEKMPVEFGTLTAIDKSSEVLIETLRYVEAQPTGRETSVYLALLEVILLAFAFRHAYLDQHVYSCCEQFEHWR